MKTKTKNKVKFLRYLFLFLVIASAQGLTDAWGQAPYPLTGNDTVCLNTSHNYGVEPTTGSTYNWSILPGIGGTIALNGGNTISVLWQTIGDYTLQVEETNQYGCAGLIVNILVHVNDLPVVDPIVPPAICSGAAIGVVLPAISTNGIALTSYDITAVVDPGLTGTATTGNGITDVNAIAGDIFVNTTAGPLTVVYTVTPYAGVCAGAPFTITVTITPAPVVDPMTPPAICSNVAIGVVLPVTSANGLGLTSYDITAVVDPGLIGAATTGTGITDPNAIAGDFFTNTTAGPLTVIYTVVPYSGTCAGAPFTITVTITPEPVVDPMTPPAICSGVAIGVVLPVSSVNGLALTSYDISAVVDPGLTGTATTGLGITDPNAIAGDIFTNTTAGSLTVVYTVVPYANTCAGAPFTITVTITPEPVVAAMTPPAVCSGNAIGVVLPITSVNGLALTSYDITAVVDPGLTGTATTGLGITDINAIAGDIFINTTAGALTVVYTVVPYAGTCAGASFTITVTITPAPVVDPMTPPAVCSGVAIGVVLPSTSTNGLGLTSYDITAVVDPGLTGIATTGNGITDVNAIAGDIFGNATGGPLTVIYTVIPYVGTCSGAPFTITVTINPQTNTSQIYHD
jgi:large repetitive protein